MNRLRAYRVRRLQRIVARHDRRVAEMGHTDSPRRAYLLLQRRAILTEKIERLS